jgi:hypothetical protein
MYDVITNATINNTNTFCIKGILTNNLGTFRNDLNNLLKNLRNELAIYVLLVFFLYEM